MALDFHFLATLSETPSVATACGPVLNLVRRWLDRRCHFHFAADSHALITFRGVMPRDLRTLFVSHVDEIGGVVLKPAEDGWYETRHWGCTAEDFVLARLQAFDYLAGDAAEAYPIEAVVREEPNGHSRVLVRGERVRPYRTAWTFFQRAEFDGDLVEGKALDPRGAVLAVLSAFREMGDPSVGVLLVMAEECAMEVAEKAVVFLQRECPNLKLIVNADVPDLRNLYDAQLDLPAIRIFEGRSMIDPSFGIDVAERLEKAGVPFHLTASLSGSQTPLFAPLAPCVSVAIPGAYVHTDHTRMSLTGMERTVRLLQSIHKLSVGYSTHDPPPDSDGP